MEVFVRFSMPNFLSDCPDDAVLYTLQYATHELYKRLAERGVVTNALSGNEAVAIFEGMMVSPQPEGRVQ